MFHVIGETLVFDFGEKKKDYADYGKAHKNSDEHSSIEGVGTG